MANMTLRLTLTVNYHAPGISDADLTERLSRAVWTAISQNLLTGSTEAWVTDYTAHIERVSASGLNVAEILSDLRKSDKSDDKKKKS